MFCLISAQKCPTESHSSIPSSLPFSTPVRHPQALTESQSKQGSEHFCCYPRISTALLTPEPAASLSSCRLCPKPPDLQTWGRQSSLWAGDSPSKPDPILVLEHLSLVNVFINPKNFRKPVVKGKYFRPFPFA